jgi:hypothetical protein
MNAALVTPFLNHLPLYPSTFMGYGAAVLSRSYKLKIIDFNAEIYFKHGALLKHALSDIRENDVILDSYYLYPLYLKLLAVADKEYDRISWSDYDAVFITMPSWFVNVPTENVLKLSGSITRKSPATKIFFFGNSLGSWTNENRLRRNKIDTVHLNEIFGQKHVQKPVNYNSLPTPIYVREKKYIFDILPFRLKHGCIWAKCNFCSLARGWNSGYKERNPQKVVEEIEALNNRYRPQMMVCSDNSINGDNLLDFCRYFDKLKKPWVAMARADLSDREIAALQESGCRLIYFGLESGSDRVLNRLNKGVSSAQASDFIKKLHDNNIKPVPSLMVGTPGETENDFGQTIDFILRHRKYLKIINCFPFMTTPASNFSKGPEASVPDTLIRLGKLLKTCSMAGLKVCVGEQSGEFAIINAVYPHKDQTSRTVSVRKGQTGLSTEASVKNRLQPFSA